MIPADCTRILAATGTDLGPLIGIGVLLLVGGAATMLLGRRMRRRHTGILLLALAATVTAGFLAIPGPAQAAEPGCAAAPSATPPAPSPTPVTPSPTPTPSSPPVTCPEGNELTLLPEGEELVWTPVVVPDPTLQPGEPGDIVAAWTDGVAGYTWSVVRTSDGVSSGVCGGIPLTDGACTPYVVAQWTTYQWIAEQGWVAIGGGGTDGCQGSGGNN